MRLTWQPIDLRVRAPLLTHKGRRPSILRQILVTLEWRGLRGTGLAVPAPDYGTSEAGIGAALRRCAPRLAGRAPDQLELVLADLAPLAEGQAGALAALDMALHDLLGQLAGLSVHRLLGLGGLPVPDTFGSIGIAAPEEAREQALALSRWRCIKLKMGAAPDFERVRAVREVHRGLLAVDANGAWSRDQAVAVIGQLAALGVDLVEQPIAAGDRAALRHVHERSPIPIVADEDCAGPADVVALGGCVDGVNIKLLKCGGLRPALRMIWLARELGLRVMLGCKPESSVGVTAMAQLAGLADWLDLDGHLVLANDPYTGLAVEDGKVRLPGGAGLGLRPAPADQLILEAHTS
jgi:L-alanine-DL-glutamate epimerase-like enolase superfamily enzyme